MQAGSHSLKLTVPPPKIGLSLEISSSNHPFSSIFKGEMLQVVWGSGKHKDGMTSSQPARNTTWIPGTTRTPWSFIWTSQCFAHLNVTWQFTKKTSTNLWTNSPWDPCVVYLPTWMVDSGFHVGIYSVRPMGILWDWKNMLLVGHLGPWVFNVEILTCHHEAVVLVDSAFGAVQTNNGKSVIKRFNKN